MARTGSGPARRGLGGGAPRALQRPCSSLTDWQPEGTGVGENPRSTSLTARTVPETPMRSNWTQINGHAGSFQKRRNHLSSGRRRGIYSIYNYLHGLQTELSGRLHCN